MVKRAKFPFKSEISSLPSHDGSSEIYVKNYWRGQPRLHFFIVHGAIEYSARHSELIDFLLTHFSDVALTVYDHVGHGLSGGNRAHIENFNVYLHDLRSVVDESLKKFSSVKMRFLLSHSMGGLIVLRSIHEKILDPSFFQGFIFSNPCIKPVVHFPQVSLRALKSLLKLSPKIHLPLLYDGKYLTHDMSRAIDFNTDNLISKFISVSMADQILESSEKLIGTSYYINFPCLFLLSEEDKVVCPESSKVYVKGIDKKYAKVRVFSDKFHDLWNEDNRHDIFIDMKKWIDTTTRGQK